MMFLCGRCDYVQVPVDYVYIMLSLRHEFCASIMQPPIYWWLCLWHCICMCMRHPISLSLLCVHSGIPILWPLYSLI